MVVVNWVFEPPIRFNSFGVPVVPTGPPSSSTLVPTEDGGAPKLLPTMVTTEPQVPLWVAVVIDGTGTTVGVVVAVGPGVFVASGVSVGAGVAPTGANALKPDVIQG